jgi:hypothetical protein
MLGTNGLVGVHLRVLIGKNGILSPRAALGLQLNHHGGDVVDVATCARSASAQDRRSSRGSKGCGARPG